MIATRSPIVRLGVSVVTPLALVAAAFLFFAGHNRPGGGFAAGLVLGAIAALRAIAGFRRLASGRLLVAWGGIVATLVALAPLVAGDALLDQSLLEVEVPMLGKVKAGSALVFDAGVTLIVVGLVVAVLDGLGARRLAGSPPAPGEVGS